MGGNVPLGYDVKDRKLIINEPEAATVRLIFRRYAELGSVALLRAELDRLGIVSKRREGAGGRLAGGQHFSRGALYLTLQTGSPSPGVAGSGSISVTDVTSPSGVISSSVIRAGSPSKDRSAKRRVAEPV